MLGTNQAYNENNQLVGQSWKIGTTAYSETYSYNESDGSLATMTSAAGQTLTYSYDCLRRLGSVNTGIYTRSYTYRDISSTTTTTQVSKVSYSGLPSNPVYSYTYDASGYISKYTAPDGEVITYTYDNLGQLVSAVGDTTYTYTYDGFGNIKTANGHTYTYGSSGWYDLLMAFDGKAFKYDTSGNPTTYYNGVDWTFEWSEGRNLAVASGNGYSVFYTYDHNGVRYNKIVNDVPHTYTYASGKLLRETYRDIILDFFYDASGTPFALSYNGTMYYYITNLQGDVMQLVDASGNVVANYEYDPYGNIISATGTMASVNPLRYRGYYFDSETGFYYLQSRYYDPAVGRFINADSYVSTGEGILGHNMFAYCLNNPVNGCDPCGSCFHRWDFWNDCEECGGKTIEDKWNDYVTCVYECYKMQIEAEQQVTEMQLQLIHDTTTQMLEFHAEIIKMQAEAQYKQDMTVRKAVTILVENPAMSANLAINTVGIGVSVIGVYGALGIISIPATANAVLSIVGLGCSLWGGVGPIAEFFNALYE